MTIVAHRRVGLCLGLVSALALMLSWTTARAEDPMASVRKVAEIHEAIVAQGIPLESVRHTDGEYELVFKSNCLPAQQTQAEQIKAAILSADSATIAVENLQDALVVLQFEPHNASARLLVKQRYDQLKAAAGNH